MYPDFTPRHTRRYAELGQLMGEAATAYMNDVRQRSFPGKEQSTSMDAKVIEALRQERKA
jgi:3-methyl-2-oxobutanoate hydroxymethyltransferase